MKQYKVLTPIGFGGRREQGEIIEMSDEDALNYAHCIAPAVEEVKIEVVEIALSEMSKANLVEKAGSLTLSTEGTKADLIERIRLAQGNV